GLQELKSRPRNNVSAAGAGSVRHRVPLPADRNAATERNEKTSGRAFNLSGWGDFKRAWGKAWGKVTWTCPGPSGDVQAPIGAQGWGQGQVPVNLAAPHQSLNRPQVVQGTNPVPPAQSFGPRHESYGGDAVPRPANQAVVDRLKSIQKRFLTLRQENWLTGDGDDVYDEAVLPALITAENARTPGLNLHLVPKEQGLGEWLKQRRSSSGRPSSERLMFSLAPDHIHYLAADVCHRNGKTSIIAMEPFGLHRDNYGDVWKDDYLPALKKELGEDVKLTIFSLDTQISGHDCRIFAMSHASKMVDNRRLFDALHQQNFDGSQPMTTTGRNARKILGDGNIRIIDGAGVLPAAFVKHAQSAKTVQNWVAASYSNFAAGGVNKSGESLPQRYSNRATERFRNPVSTEHALRAARRQHWLFPAKKVEVRSTITNPSIEDKRIVYLQRAIDYFERADETESDQILNRMRMPQAANRPEVIGASEKRSREWGPRPAGLLYSANYSSRQG
ncbi:MAG TPA: YopJ family acetyltransferase, partial [Burkholderiaceae bacterium]|nr:YopJ family acetyltransferase [Burkholderiaceae bacterium]